MNPLTLIGVFAVIMSMLQMTIPNIILSLKPTGVRTVKAARMEGTLPSQPVVFINRKFGYIEGDPLNSYIVRNTGYLA